MLLPVSRCDQSQRTARDFATGEKSRERLLAACRGDFGNGEDRYDERAGYRAG